MYQIRKLWGKQGAAIIQIFLEIFYSRMSLRGIQLFYRMLQGTGTMCMVLYFAAKQKEPKRTKHAV